MIRHLMSYNNSDRILAEYNADIIENWDGISSLSSDKALKSDLTSIFETGTVATQNIPKDTFFYLNNILVKSLINIVAGVLFIKNTNYEIITEGALIDMINELLDIDDRLPFNFGINSNNKYGFYKVNASTVIPFNYLIPVNPETTTGLNYYIEE